MAKYEWGPTELKFNIVGQTPSKKRNWTIVRQAGGRPTIALRRSYKQWEEAAVKQLWLQGCAAGIDTPIAETVQATFKIFLKTKREADLTNLIQSCEDALVKANILADDKFIRSLDGSR
nr:RusA family crossover junction endodeoxyribonuclease [Burkholderiales bacterium]